jgi:hydroxymethylglutaryl-CoA lyase
MTAKFPKRVEIREVGPREGFQSYHRVVPTADKLRLIAALSATGLKEIEVTSFVRADRVPQMADAEELVVALPEVDPSVRFTALYLNQVGFKRSEAFKTLQCKGWLYTSPSQSFLKANSNTSIEQELLRVTEWTKLFREHGKYVHGLMISNAFGCAYEGAVTSTAVAELIERYRQELGKHGESLREVCLADTVGMGTPQTVAECIERVGLQGIPVSLHLHDTRGLGLTNAYVALELGVSIFESSVGGIGGCPFTPGAAGNIATEDLVYLLNSLGIDSGVDLPAVCQAARLCEGIMGMPLPGRVYRT